MIHRPERELLVTFLPPPRPSRVLHPPARGRKRLVRLGRRPGDGLVGSHDHAGRVVAGRDELEDVGDSRVPGRSKWMQVEASLLD